MKNNVLEINDIDLNLMKIGNKQNFNNNDFLPIYYVNNDIDNFIVKTDKLYVNKSQREYNNQYFIEILFRGDELFYEFIKKFEKRIKRKLRRYKDKQFISLLKFSDYYGKYKLFLPINKNSECVDVNNDKQEWTFNTPSYSYFVIFMRNIWIKNNNWGINIYTYSCMSLQNQIGSIKPIPKLKFIFNKEQEKHKEEINNNIINDEKYSKFFKMKKMGIPVMIIKQKLTLAGLDPNIIDNQIPIKTNIIDNNSIINNNIKKPVGGINSSLLGSMKLKKVKVEKKKRSYKNNNTFKISDDDLLSAISKLKKIEL